MNSACGSGVEILPNVFFSKVATTTAPIPQVLLQGDLDALSSHPEVESPILHWPVDSQVGTEKLMTLLPHLMEHSHLKPWAPMYSAESVL